MLFCCLLSNVGFQMLAVIVGVVVGDLLLAVEHLMLALMVGVAVGYCFLLLVVGCRVLTAIVGVAICALSFVECRLLTVG
jgi:hypothetical protein